MSYQDVLRIAHEAADAAADTARLFFGGAGLGRRFKADGSLATAADLACEDAVRARLHRLAPNDEILAEEQGGATAAADRWIIDPIDGTENFSRGNPVWATLIARQEGGQIVAGVVSAPALGRRWWAGSGMGAYSGQDERIRVSARTDLRQSTLCLGGLHECPSAAARQRLVQLAQAFRCAWGWGNFWGHAQVAEGAAEAALSFGTEIWDVAALRVLVVEAGGTASDVTGGSALAFDSLLTSNGTHHHELAQALTGPG
ncbi:MAG TPA: inositol monophosphatase family protein [Micromonosporaceae bacterium]